MMPASPLRWISAILAVAVLSARGVEITAIEPPVVAPGKTAILLIKGSELWDESGTRVWISEGGAVTEIAAMEGGLRCAWAVPEELPAGVVGLRVFHGRGASAVAWLTVENLPLVAVAASKAPTDAPTLSLPAAVRGTTADLQRAFFRVAGQAGQCFAIEVLGQGIASGLDPVVAVRDARGRELAYQDDHPALGRDVHLVFSPPSDGDFWIELTDVEYRGGLPFHLRIGQLPVPRPIFPPAMREPDLPREVIRQVRVDGHVAKKLASPREQNLEQEPNETLQQAQAVPFGTGISGRLDQAKDRDVYALRLTAGEWLTVRPRTRSLGSAAVLRLTLQNERGVVLAEAGEGDALEETLRYRCRATEMGYLQVEELLGQNNADLIYHLSIDHRIAPVQLAVDSKAAPGLDRLAAAPGGQVKVKVLLTRFGYDGPVDFRGPPGWSVSPARLAEKAKDAELTITLPADLQPASLADLAVETIVEVDGLGYTARWETQAAAKVLWPALGDTPAWFDGVIPVAVIKAP